MASDPYGDTPVFLISAILTLLAITSKLVTANLVTRTKRAYNRLDARRREIQGRLKEAQLKATSARGTLEFWQRRRTETSHRVQDMRRDLEVYEDRFGPASDELAGEAEGFVGGAGGEDPDEIASSLEAERGSSSSGAGDVAADAGSPPARSETSDGEGGATPSPEAVAPGDEGGAGTGSAVPEEEAGEDSPGTD